MIRLLEVGVKTEYAVRSLVMLAEYGRDAVVTVKELAERAEISVHFLYSIFDLLERHGLVRAHKGRQRGFSLMRHPDEITFLDILYAVQGPIEKRQCLLDRRLTCCSRSPCSVHEVWFQLQEQLEFDLQAITLEKIAHQQAPWERVRHLIAAFD